MATTKFKFRASSVLGKEGTLFIQVIHKRVIRQVSTSYKLFPEEWDAQRQLVVQPADERAKRRPYLRALQEALQRDASRLQLIILALNHSRMSYQAEDVIRRFLLKEHTEEFVAFAETCAARKRAEGNLSLADKYQTSINSFKRFLNNRCLVFNDIDASLMHSYEVFLRKRGLCPNTSSFYMRNLRAIYNLAVEQGLAAQRNPFSRVYTGIAPTRKRAVSAKDVQKLKALELPPNSPEAQSRDIFLFSLYTCGMSLIDIAYLKKSDIQDGYITYFRQKTGQRILIRWEPCMQQLADKYTTEQSPYLFPFITRPGQNERLQYRNKAHQINQHLKRLGERLHFTSKLTSYVARHSWASIARSLEVPVSAISEAMGHTSERTTRIYLKSFKNTVVDRANKKVLSTIA
ncbi:MAG: tyrosine-type recombinase/integrase [Alloprevotella sp.]